MPDVNVVAYLFLEGDKTSQAQEVYQKDPLWALPQLWQHEFLNILATLGRSRQVNLAELQKIRQRVWSSLEPLERPVNLPFALDLAHHYKITAYDAQYLALAMELKTVCVTEDRKLRLAVPGLALSMNDFCKGETE